MSRQVVSTVFQFDELSDRAKERARDWFREHVFSDSSDWENVIEDAARMADLIGINLRNRRVPLMGGGSRMEPEIYFSGFSSQGDGACFVGSYRYRVGSVRDVAKEAPATWTDKQTHERKENASNAEVNRITRELAALQRRHFYKLTATIRHTGRYSHEHSVSIDVECECNSCRRNPVDDDENIADLLRDFMRWIYRSLETEYEYQMSDECVDENIRANEYEFTEDGDRS